MSEKGFRNIFLFGTLVSLIVLGVMAANTLAQVGTLRTPALTADVIAGKETWQAKNCNDCHTILGIGGYFAPELTRVIDRRDPTWLNSFLLDPQVAKPGTTMPKQNLTAAQVTQLISFFQWVAKVDTNGWPPKPLVVLGGASQTTAQPGDLTQEGLQIYSQKGCNACHMINGMGASGPGPNLSTIGSQPYDALANDPAFLTAWLKDPQAQKTGTTMPRITLTDSEISALVAYLTSLK